MNNARNSVERVPQAPLALSNWTLLVFAISMFGWTAAWLMKLWLATLVPWTGTAAASSAYWTLAKVLLWILPALGLIRLSGRSLAQVINLRNYRSWLLWGGGIGLAIGANEFVPSYLAGRPLLPTEWSFALANVLLIAPTFEELLMRGALLGNFEQRYPFWQANVLTSLLFVVLHLPGWYFMGNLWNILCQPIGGALSIFLVSLAFGYAVRRSRSVMGGVLAHFLNNLASA